MFTLIAALALQSRQNDAVIPVPDPDPDRANSYKWMDRHNGVLNRVKQGNVDLVLIGDSITHLLGGVPSEGGNNGPGSSLWPQYFEPRHTVNLGFGWDRTQHVLWRLQNGEIDGISPKVAVIMIGTNNIGRNTTPEIADGVKTIVDTVHLKLPKTRIRLLGIFPRSQKPDNKDRKQVVEVNAEIAKLQSRDYVTYLDISRSFIEDDGTISRSIMRDMLHPTLAGYQKWMDAMEPTLAWLMRLK